MSILVEVSDPSSGVPLSDRQQDLWGILANFDIPLSPSVRKISDFNHNLFDILDYLQMLPDDFKRRPGVKKNQLVRWGEGRSVGGYLFEVPEGGTSGLNP